MEFKKKTLETQIIEIFQKISPAITRLIQSETDNANIVINLGKTKSKNKNEININPSILVNAVSDSELEFKELIIGTVVHEAIHSMEEYNFNVDEDLTKYKDDTEGLTNIDEVLEVLAGPFGKYIFEILVHSYDEFQFVKNFNGLRSILEDIYKESSINIKNLKPFNKFLTLLFHNITGYVELDIEKYPKNIKEPLKETLRVLDNFSYDKNLIEDTIDITIEITDICRRYNLLPDVDNQTLGERRESIENFEDSVIDDLNKVLIPSSTNITSGNTLEKFLGKKGADSEDEKLNFMDDHVSKVGTSSTVYLPNGKVSKLLSTNLPKSFKNLYTNGLNTYNSLLEEWDLPVFKVTNKIKPYFIHNKKRLRISGYDQGDLSPHVPLMLASGRYERMFEQKQRLSNKSYAVSLLIDGSGSMLEKDKGDFYPWSLSAALIGASYLAQICHELDIDFEVAIFNRSFAADELENEELYLKRKMAVSSMLNTNYGSNAEYYFNTTNHYFIKKFDDSWKENYEKFIGLIEFSRNLRESLDKIESNLDHPPASMFERGTNVDERNIMFSTKRLLEKGSKTKLLAVLSDGMTRGSLEDLKSSINYASKVGIDVIGIGIGERGTWKEYINKTQINEPEELIHSIVNITKDILIKNIEESTGVA
ncbi:MAG: hypothetical protein VYC78_01855 [Actinomycetota bacterium]|jgi:hypothetical protein|nr:hypothetical protein [Actinomycetota bacterium]MEC8328979.1 hypothetical protein [Actinomycetota bacterium]MED5382794.1 hypothetical protein [Actinomycetota bacterium]GIS38512.1 MAG: hypothetical protein Ct9H90mP10_09130 [Actinomycetota bacterium]|tara:strand:+ start:410 stop:2362 length:1953 start_codon:yes stop_codon:yes gene_type:complete